MTTWQAVPQEELTRLANRLRDLRNTTRGVLHVSLQAEIESVERMLNYCVEQAPSYNEAAGLYGEPAVDPWTEVEGHPFSAWRHEVQNRETVLGYDHWVIHRIEAAGL